MAITDPRAKAPIPIIAAVLPWTPPSLDPLRELDRDLPLLLAESQQAEEEHVSLQRQREAGTIVGTHAEDLIREAFSRKLDAGAAIKKRRDAATARAAIVGTPPRFHIRIPTALERQKLNVRLLGMGLTAVSDEQIRASMIETLYEVDWAREHDADTGDRQSYNELYADESAALLDSFWQRAEIQGAAYQRWRDQETERLLDALEGAPVEPAEPAPVRLISIREEAKVKLLTERLMEAPRMRKLIARRIDFARANAVLLARINLAGVEGLVTEIAPDPRDDAVPEAAINQLREELDHRYGKAIAEEAWLELIGHIDRLYTLEDFEVGNFASPLERRHEATGSVEPSTDTATSGGSSTEPSIDPAPGAGSATIIEKPSASTSECETQAMSTGPMDAA